MCYAVMPCGVWKIFLTLWLLKIVSFSSTQKEYDEIKLQIEKSLQRETKPDCVSLKSWPLPVRQTLTSMELLCPGMSQ